MAWLLRARRLVDRARQGSGRRSPMGARKSKREQTTAKHRASWRGFLSFGLVSFPVEAYNALDKEHGDIHFHQIHAECHNRIRYKKVCPIHGEVSDNEIVSGYEYKKGKYVEVRPEELGPSP